MLNCDKCILNCSTDSSKNGSGDYIPEIFRCHNPFCAGYPAACFLTDDECKTEAGSDNDDNVSAANGTIPPGNPVMRRQPCLHDAYVLTFINSRDKFAESTAEDVLETLVEAGCPELLCELFLNSQIQVRARLWQRMVTQHRDRLYLLDALFEKCEFASPPPDSATFSLFELADAVTSSA